LRGEERCQGKHGGSGNRAPRDKATHESGITEPPPAQELRASAQNLYGFCIAVKGEMLSKLLVMRERATAVLILRGF
jgi:hypothetical protein